MRSTLFVLLILSIITFSACEKASVAPVYNQNIVTSDSASTSGRLTVKVVDEQQRPVENASVYLYANYTDYQNNIDLFFLRSDRNGKADFGYVNIGNYYVLADATIGGVLKRGLIAMQVRSQRVEEKPVIVR